MKLLKIALLTIIATLFSLPATASDFTQNVEFEVDSSGILEGMRAPTIYNMDSASEFDLLDADLIEWDMELENAQHLCATQTCQVRLTARNASGGVVGSVQTVDIQLDGSSALFTATIDGGDVATINSFFASLASSAAVRIEFQPELEVEKIDDDQQANLQVGNRYNEALVAEDFARVPFFDLTGL